MYIPNWEIQNLVMRLASEINRDYGRVEEEVVLISILDGSFIFMADLIRQLEFDHHVQFVKLTSYKDMSSTGVVDFVLDVQTDLRGKHIIIVEDIVDTGLTIESFLEQLQLREPASIRICTLLSKPDEHNDIVPLDYVGVDIPPEFVIGYGLDLNGLGRQLRDIYKLKV
ncbi:MAG: hypoxanthine phosphoribosyltransferase [Saprospiraceae bacterium]|nr:hypoxanthine phosphoribosyltransferase [Saprospiraceae bacterium]